MLSLIICTHNRANEIYSVLQALKKQIVAPDEIIFIDASADSATELIVVSEQKDYLCGELIYYRVTDEHRGLTRQRNFGITQARGDVISFLDDDTIPEPNYFAEILKCFDRNHDAVGVGGYIHNEVQWKLKENLSEKSFQTFSYQGWERREDLRWQLRKLLGLDSPLQPGWIAESGHGRSLGFIPPDGRDYSVQCLMGGASSWKKEIFSKISFSHYFEGYGLYEDLDFSLKAYQEGKLYLCTQAKLAHYHAPNGRPNHFKYGKMVVRNGWFVWRRQYSSPQIKNRIKWYATTCLLLFLRFVDIRNNPNRAKSFTDGLGRIWGLSTLVWNRPKEKLGK